MHTPGIGKECPVQPQMPDQYKMRPREEAVVQVEERERGGEREDVRAVKHSEAFAVHCMAGLEEGEGKAVELA